MSSDEMLNKHLEVALESLEIVMGKIISMPREKSKSLYEAAALGRSIGLIREFQKPIFSRNPELKPPPPEDYVPDRDMNEDEKSFVSKFSTEKLQKIDSALLSYAHSNYSKVAALVAKTIFNESVHTEGTPDVFYSLRIKCLVESGALESQGDLKIMRYSEVRLPKA